MIHVTEFCFRDRESSEFTKLIYTFVYYLIDFETFKWEVFIILKYIHLNRAWKYFSSDSNASTNAKISNDYVFLFAGCWTQLLVGIFFFHLNIICCSFFEAVWLLLGMDFSHGKIQQFLELHCINVFIWNGIRLVSKATKANKKDEIEWTILIFTKFVTNTYTKCACM